MHDVRVVGSCVRKDERPDSDVDFLVKLSEGSGGLASENLGDGFAANS